MEMHSSLVYLLAFGIGLVTGLRSMTGPALVCWAAHLGWLNLEDSRLVFMESRWPRTVSPRWRWASLSPTSCPSFRTGLRRDLCSVASCWARSRDRRSVPRPVFPRQRRDTRRSGRSGWGIRGISGTRAFGEDFGFARLGDCPGGRSGRGRRRSSPGFAILIVSQDRQRLCEARSLPSQSLAGPERIRDPVSKSETNRYRPGIAEAAWAP